MTIKKHTNSSARLQEILSQLSAERIVKSFQNLTQKWHIKAARSMDSTQGIESTLVALHYYNFMLWHLEDEARRIDVADSVVAGIKRKIDKANQSRNDTIEQLNLWLLSQLESFQKCTPQKAELHSETPGSIIDRLSILSLKIYHMREQTQRADVKQDHIEKAKQRLKILKEQLEDLMVCLDMLIDDFRNGRKKLKLYFQFKLYNDPTMNPALYQQK